VIVHPGLELVHVEDIMYGKTKAQTIIKEGLAGTGIDIPEIIQFHILVISVPLIASVDTQLIMIWKVEGIIPLEKQDRFVERLDLLAIPVFEPLLVHPHVP
jgi:hypothetical protein